MPTDGRGFHRRLRATPEAVRDILSDLVETLSGYELSTEECASVELVLAEAMNNIVQHAYPDTRDGEISIDIEIAPTGLLCRLADCGIPMPEGCLALGGNAAHEIRPETLPEGGFGWFLIRSLARDLRYTRSSAGNLLEFRISVLNRTTLA